MIWCWDVDLVDERLRWKWNVKAGSGFGYGMVFLGINVNDACPDRIIDGACYLSRKSMKLFFIVDIFRIISGD